MRMVSKVLVFGLSMMVCGFAADLRAQEGDAEEMMKQWQEAMAPNENHALLKQREGKWTYKVKMWMAPGAPPQESEGKSSSKMAMGGRYLIDHVEGEFNGMPFKGMSILGYDNVKKKFVSSWIDNFGTGFMVGTGTYDAEKKTWTFKTEQSDPMSGKTAKGRSVERLVDENHWEMTMYSIGPDGKEMKSMEIKYTRVK